jgi:phage I-like protein
MVDELQTTAIELAAKAGDVPDEIHLFPLGRSNLLDGRVFTVKDAEGIIARSMGQRPNDLPIDYEHQNDNKEAVTRGPIPAAGWITSMVVKQDGIWGKVEWTDRARQMIAAREYRYISPSFQANKKTGEVHMIKGAALVHIPALTMTALARAEDDPDTETVTARFAAALGLDRDADAEEILQAITAKSTPDPAEFVPVAALRDLQAETAAVRERDIEAKVGAAVKGAYITPAMRDWATELCRSNPDSFDTFISSQPPAWGHILTSQFDGIDQTSAPRETEMESHICRQLGLASGSLGD